MEEQGKKYGIQPLAHNEWIVNISYPLFVCSYLVDDYLSLYHYINYILSYHEFPNVYESINFRYTDYDSIHYNTQPYQCKITNWDSNTVAKYLRSKSIQ